MINVFQPSLGQEEIAALEEVFRSNWIGRGDSVIEFEQGFANKLNANPNKFFATTCCTEGLFLASELFGYSADDEIIVPSISFVSVGSSVVSSGAKLVFCDVDRRSLNATAEHIESKITEKTKAVILNHYGGVSCEMEPILCLCQGRGIKVIEDSACALKSFYKGRACGTMGDMGLWSFDAMKVITTGDGGMIYIDSDRLLSHAKEFLYLGLPEKQKSGVDSSTDNSTNWWEVEIHCPGRRAIMNNISGAIGLSQLAKVDEFIARRKELFDLYVNELSDLEWVVLPPELSADFDPSRYFFWIQLEKRNQLARFLLEHDIYTTFRYWPLHRVAYFQSDSNELPNSDHVSECTLNLPLHQSLSEDDVFEVVQVIKEFGSVHV